MADLIDKAALLESFKETIERTKIWRDDCRDLGITTEYADRAFIDFNEAALRVKNFPTVDAVEIVRCKECINFTQGKDEWGSCFENPMKMWRDTDYCSWGERRTDERFDRQTGGDSMGKS